MQSDEKILGKIEVYPNDLELVVESEWEVDVFAPRTRAVLRHGSAAMPHAI